MMIDICDRTKLGEGLPQSVELPRGIKGSLGIGVTQKVAKNVSEMHGAGVSCTGGAGISPAGAAAVST